MAKLEEYRTPLWFQISIQCLILYSIVSTFLETLPELEAYADFFSVSEIIVVAIFTIEYGFLWIKSSNKRTYPFGFMAIIDLLAVAPFYLGAAIALRGIRVFRLLRITRLLKLGRYNKAIELDPNYALAYYNCGVIYQNRGETEKAKLDFAKAKELGYEPE